MAMPAVQTSHCLGPCPPVLKSPSSYTTPAWNMHSPSLDTHIDRRQPEWISSDHVVFVAYSKTDIFLSHLSRSLADRWGTTVDFTTSFLHSVRFTAFRSIMFHGRPVHCLMLSSHRFLCLPLRLPPSTVPCRIVLASPDDRVTCPYHFSMRLFTEVRSSYGPIAFPIVAFTSSLMIKLFETGRNWHDKNKQISIWHRVVYVKPLLLTKWKWYS